MARVVSVRNERTETGAMFAGYSRPLVGADRVVGWVIE